ncbi:STM3941 family protein [Flavobacterium selenitireducens]|uniref:STM3941 family protein n=1 Tax=Flavobacterium selenitireducens TaxID=2722704 RepID=UPI00168B81B8|nr:STM3941 family protein [Flavobacterium selenitireducens]MBD3581868.1 hypothetical protein [Flavobacterium selenitireducens]
MEKMELKKSVFKALKLVILSSLLLAMGVYLIASGESGKQAIGWVNAVLFGFTLLAGLSQVFDRRVQLSADRNGLYERMSLTEPIDWSAIESIVYKKAGTIFSSQHFAEVTLRTSSDESLASKIKVRPFSKPQDGRQPLKINLLLTPLEGKPREIVEKLNQLRDNHDK